MPATSGALRQDSLIAVTKVRAAERNIEEAARLLRVAERAMERHGDKREELRAAGIAVRHSDSGFGAGLGHVSGIADILEAIGPQLIFLPQ